MRSLFKDARKESVLHDLALEPLEPAELQVRGITSLHVHTFTGMSRVYASISDYASQVQQSIDANQTTIQ